LPQVAEALAAPGRGADPAVGGLPRIAVLSSRMGSIGLRANASGWLYRASKAALNSVMKDAALTLQGRALCLALHPGWVRTDMGGAEADIDAATSVAGMRQTLDRAGKFLSLVALLAALLSAVAVAIVARGFAANHLDACAMLRVLGQSQRSIALAYTLEFLLVGLLASLLGLVLGYAVHHVFVMLLAGLVESQLPQPGLAPVGLGLGMDQGLSLPSTWAWARS
jgi:hypothetical protein